MKRQRQFDKTLYGILSIVIIVFILVTIVFATLSYDKDDSYEKISAWDEGWILETPNGKEKSVTIPTEKINSDEYKIKSVLPRSLSSNDFLFVWANNQKINISVNGTKVFSYEPVYEKYINKDLAAEQYLLIPVSSSYSGKDIEISYKNCHFAKGRIGHIYLGDKASVISHLLRMHLLTLIAGFIVIIFGLLSIVRYIGNRQVLSNQIHSTLYTGIAMILLSMWFFLQIEARQFIVSNVFLARDLNYIVQLLIPVPFVAYLEEKKFYKEVMIFAWTDLIDMFLYFIILFSGIANQQQISLLIDIPLDFSVVFCAFTIIYIIIKDRKLFEQIKVTIYAAAVLAACGIMNTIIFYITGNTGTFLPIGIVFFTIVEEIQNTANVMKTVKKDIEFHSYKKSQKSLLASVSHEIRTPINAVLGLDEMIIREAESDKVRDYAYDIKTSGELLLSLVNDILEFSKMESGILRLVPKEYSLTNLLTEVCTVIRTKAEAKDLEFIVKVNPDTPEMLVGDSQRIRQVLLNLLNNAVKYTQEGSVTFTVDFDEREENSVRILYHIIDTGIGIREQDITKIFQPFVRVDEEKNKKIEGTGLGMGITENLLELMGSRVSVESKYGQGSDFSCRIVQEVNGEKTVGKFDPKAVIQSSEDSDGAFKCPNAKILVVDDTRLNLKVFQGLLKASEAKIETALSGPDAIENSKKTKYDIIFMDQKMPSMDGFEAMKEIKNNKDCSINKETPIVLLTANATPGMYEEAIKEGFSDYLTKPIVIGSLNKIIRNLLPEEKIVEINEDGTVASKDEGTDAFSRNSENSRKSDGKTGGSGNASKGKAGDAENAFNASGHKESSDNKYANLLDILRSECALDTEEAIKGMGNEEIYISILSEFSSIGAKNADEIEAFKDSKDIENYTIKVHALKSSARIIGAKVLSSEAKDLEELGDMAKGGNKEALARIEMSTEKLLSDYRSLSESINDVLKMNGIDVSNAGEDDTDEKNLPEISASDLKEAYSVISEMTEAFDIDAIKSVLNSLKDYKIPDSEKEKIKAISESVSEINYEGIRKAINVHN